MILSAIDTSLAVIIPIESILATSAYVKVPPIVTLPLKEPVDAVTLPSNDVAVQTPDTVKPAVNSGAPVPDASAKLSARTLPPDLPSAGNV